MSSKHKVLVAVGVAVAVVGLWALAVRAVMLPTVYTYPNGECATVVEYTENGPVRRECGWHKDQRHNVAYVAYNTNLAQLAEK